TRRTFRASDRSRAEPWPATLSGPVLVDAPAGVFHQHQRVVEIEHRLDAGELARQRLDRAVEHREVAALQERQVVERITHRRHLVAGALESRHDALLLSADPQLEAGDAVL